MKNKIGWCDMTWNPVWGCLNHCEYCYARKISKRFYGEIYNTELPRYMYSDGQLDPTYAVILKNKLKEFQPLFLYSQFEKQFPEKPQRIFVGSMSEIYYWGEEWVEKVLEKVKQYTQHTFQFLTKYPEVYTKYNFPDNCWLGVTITRECDIDESDIDYYDRLFSLECIKFLSLEPLYSSIPKDFIECFDWVIIGAETGNRKGKIIPKREWIENIGNYCRDKNIPVYLKDSIYKIYPVWPIIKEFPKNNL
jgi:protein gp37